MLLPLVDSLGDPIKCIWKTWAWETALDQIRSDIDSDNQQMPLDSHQQPRIVDVMLRPGVAVFEPIWTLVTSNKALLPVIWQMFPDHQYLLNSQFQLTESLKKTGYAAKPIVGRQGENIAIVGKCESILSTSEGRFSDRDTVFQELRSLPQLEGKNVQISTFTVQGSYAGACARGDSSLIIKGESDVYPLRVVSNVELLI